MGPNSIAPTNTGIAFITTTNAISGAAGLNLYELDLSTLAVTTVNIQGNDLFLGLPALLASANNGSTVMAYFLDNSSGINYTWTATSGTWTVPQYVGGYLFDGAVSGDGNAMAIDQPGTFAMGAIISFFDSSADLLGRSGLPEYLQMEPALAGMKLDGSGGLAYVPVQPNSSAGFSGDAVDIYGVKNNNLLERVLLSEQFPAPVSQENSLAIDPTGQNIFMITNKGLTIVTLDAVPLSIGSITPSSGAGGTSLTIRGSGFVSAVTATFNGTAAPVAFVDSETLTVTVPSSLASGGTSVTLTNPNGSSYALSDCFTVD